MQNGNLLLEATQFSETSPSGKKAMRVIKPLSWKMRLTLQSAALWCDRRGVSAIEFAMLVPILTLMYIGTVQIGNLLTLMRRVETAASTAADLAAQKREVSVAELDDIVGSVEKHSRPVRHDAAQGCCIERRRGPEQSGQGGLELLQQRIWSRRWLVICAACGYHGSQLKRHSRRSDLRFHATVRSKDVL